MEKTNLPLSILLTLLAYFCIASASACVQILSRSFPVFEIVFFQNLICLFCIIPYCIKDKTLNFRFSHIPLHLIRTIAGTFSFLTYFLAIRMLHLVDATILLSTAPFFVPFLWKIYAKEPLEKDVWWSIILGFLGVLIILQSKNNRFLQSGTLIGIFSALLSGIGLVSLKTLIRRKESLSRSLFFYFFVGGILSFFLSIFQWSSPTTTQVLFLFAVGIASFFAQLLLTVAYRYGTASFLSPLSYSAILFTALINWVLFSSSISLKTLVGAAFIIGGGTLSYILRAISSKAHA